MAYDQYIVGVAGVIASLLGFVLLYYNFLARFMGPSKLKTTASVDYFPKENKAGNNKPVETTDVIIVGAGVAGASLAYALAKDGRRVRVIERDLNPPERIAGEGLMPGGYLKLIELGLEDCVEEIDSVRILGYILYRDGKEAPISYPLEKFQSHVAGRNFHNNRFIQRLRNKVASLHNVNLEQGTVTSLLKENGTVKGVHYKDKNGQLLMAYAPLTVVCDGCFSNLRRSLCYPKIDVPSHCVGFVLTDCKLPLENYGAIFVTHPSCFAFYPISSNEIRCMVEVIGPKLPAVSDGEMVHYLKTHVAPKVPPKLYDAFMTAIEKKDNIKTMPNRIMAAAPHPTPGAMLIGDAFNMRHAIAGGGMTVALSDVVLLRDLLRPLGNLSDASAVCEYLESFYTLRKPMSSTMNIMGNVIQKVFGESSDPSMMDMQEGCFEYLRLGGMFSYGLSGLMSGLCPHPSTLALHFCAMAVYDVGRLLLPFPTPRGLWNAAKFLWVASRVVPPLIQSEGVRQMFFPFAVPAYYRSPPRNKDVKV